MLKGTMKIEMTDVNTGQTETVLEQNMVTNALSNIFKPLGLVKDPGRMYDGFAPYYQKLLGGLLLFDNTIEEMQMGFIHLQMLDWWVVQSTGSRTIPRERFVAVSTRRRAN